MKTKRLLFISCLAAGALIASPSFGKPAKKSAGMSKAKRVAPHTTQVVRNVRHNQNISPRTGSTRYYGGTRYTGTRSYAARQYSGTRYYGGNTITATLMGAAPAIIMADPLTRTTATIPARRTSNWGYGTSGYYPYYVLWGRLSIQWLQQLLLVLHANVRL